MEHAVTHYSGGPPGSPPPGPPGPGYGWNGGWAPLPDAPKPGVVPLRPLGLGDILSGTFSAFGRYWKPLLGTAVVAYGTALLVACGAMAVAYALCTAEFDVIERSIRANDSEPPTAALVTVAVTFGVAALFGVLCLMAAAALTQAASPAVLQEAVLGRPVTFRQVWGRAVRRFPAVLGALAVPWLLSLLVGTLLSAGYVALMITIAENGGGGGTGVWAAVGLGLGLLLAPVVVWLWVLFSLAPAVAVFESAGPVRALRRSARLVKGSWWRVFGITLLLWLMATMASWLIQMPFNLLGMFSMIPGMDVDHTDDAAAAVQTMLSVGGYVLISLLGTFLSQILVTYFPQLTTGLLYVDQRIRREGLAPALIEAARVPPQPRY
ncbi:hypothetical protein ACQPZG_26480 [Streptomyces sp. CA-294286]|uniref:hypothetical protein n=1 Tax=Streptomyces sp. CA-294286 TaxID=3240070 RepID=UPI003D9353F0